MATANALRVADASRHLSQPAAGPVEPSWLHTAGQIAGVALMIELLIALLIVAALMFGLAFGMWWLSHNVVPVIGQYSAQAQRYIEIAERGSDRVANGVASFHGARAGVAAGLKAFFLPGRGHRSASASQPLAPHAWPPPPEPAANPTPTPTGAFGQRAAPRPSPAARAFRSASPADISTPRVAGRALGVVAGRVAGRM